MDKLTRNSGPKKSGEWAPFGASIKLRRAHALPPRLGLSPAPSLVFFVPHRICGQILPWSARPHRSRPIAVAGAAPFPYSLSDIRRSSCTLFLAHAGLRSRGLIGQAFNHQDPLSMPIEPRPIILNMLQDLSLALSRATSRDPRKDFTRIIPNPSKGYALGGVGIATAGKSAPAPIRNEAIAPRQIGLVVGNTPGVHQALGWAYDNPGARFGDRSRGTQGRSPPREPRASISTTIINQRPLRSSR